MPRSDSSVTESRQERLFVLEAELFCQGINTTFFAQCGVIQRITVQIAFEDLPSQRQTSFALLRFQPVSDFSFGAGRLDKLQPITRRYLLWCRNDFDGIAATQDVFQSNQLAVNPRAGTVMADVGM